ncbi:hypothetical protein PMAYCL1PPCAC_23580 [Pristionchus mayeri]|uniref:TIMELESS-interacting protein n=1 Tax=Pristionchus mayeri TaxID=1317129 RepID=A0AAN5I6T6_9BILA|nr:hypothetical protein PMAYCL1PPCAC_23580 [Pristionchus mayeri]
MDLDDEAADFFGEDELFGDTDAIGEDEAIEDNRYDGVGGGSKDDLSDFMKKEKKAGSTRKKTNPRALLNEKSLIGRDGIQTLKESFTNYNPNAKADPYSHLPGLLKKYQHWAHVLAPRMKFEDVISRCEQLGEKRPIKVYMAKIRMGMPLTDEDFEMETTSRKRRNSEDGIITTEYASDRERSPSPPPRKKSLSPPPKNIEPAQPRSLFGPAKTSAPAVVPIVSSAAATQLTEEQRRRIAENRLRAMELRAKREEEEREKEERERRREEEENMPPEERMEEAPTLDEDEIMAQFDDFE